MERGSTPVISALKCTDGGTSVPRVAEKLRERSMRTPPPPPFPLLPRRPTRPRQPRSRTAICIIFTLASPRLASPRLASASASAATPPLLPPPPPPRPPAQVPGASISPISDVCTRMHETLTAAAGLGGCGYVDRVSAPRPSPHANSGDRRVLRSTVGPSGASRHARKSEITSD